ncbi:MAG TPA: tail fiber domain-containing protein [Pyrinomonadaceae bacterium]|jgi:hypothetical protein
MNLKRLAFTLALTLSVSLLCRAQEQQPAPEAPVPPTSDAPVTSATGTPGKVAKFTTASNIEDSVMTENSSKIGINVAPPTATLHVNGPHPSTVATNGANATLLLQTSGGKGGNTSAAGKTAGKGAGISLVTGDGGDAVSGSTNGDGGSITLQPGLAGTGGNGGATGFVLLAPGEGFVGIGTKTPTSKLTVEGSSNPDAVIKGVNNGAGDAIYGLTTSDFRSAVRGENLGSGNGVFGSADLGTGVEGYSPSGTGVFGKSINSQGVVGFSDSNTGVRGESTAGVGTSGKSSTNYGVSGLSTSKAGVYGESSSSYGVSGKATGSGIGVSGVAGTGQGVSGQSTSNSGVFGFSTSGDGVTGQSVSGYAGRFYGKTKVTKNLEIDGSEFYGATTRQMINLWNTSYGIGIQASTEYFRTAGGYNWYMGGVHNNTQNSPGTGGVSLMRLDSAGNLVVKGSVTATNISNPSDRALKSNFASVNPRAVLDRLASMPVQTWNYKSEGAGVRHMGPMAQDFRAAFNLGTDDKTISTVDTAGVTMAAVQGLYRLAQEKDRQIEQLTNEAKTLRSELDDLRARMLQLEEALKRQQK